MSTTKRLWILGVTAIGITAIGVLGKMSVAQQSASISGLAEGRYKLTVNGESNPSLVIFDSQTGRCWYKASPSDDFKWRDITPPALTTK